MEEAMVMANDIFASLVLPMLLLFGLVLLLLVFSIVYIMRGDKASSGPSE